MAQSRNLLVLAIVLVVLGGVGYWQRERVEYFWKHTVQEKWHALAPASPPPRGGGSALPMTVSHVPPPSRPGEKEYAQSGTFYMVERVKVTNRNGIQAVNPGEHVKLLERLPDGKLRVTIDHADFTVTAKQVTNDLDVAREAERKFQAEPPLNL